MFDACRPTYTHDEVLPTAGRVAEIVDSTWEGDFLRSATWRDGFKNVHDNTQRSALAAQAAAVPAPEPCNLCRNNRGIFAECAINACWPENGACVSCGFWGRARQCSYGYAVTKTPSKAKTMEKAVETLTSEISTVHATLAALEKDLKESPFIRWESVKNAPNEVEEICEKAVKYFALRKEAKKDAAEKLKQLGELVELQKKLMAGLDGNANDSDRDAGNDESDDADDSFAFSDLDDE
ncbi:hypothetical protein KEM55_002064 [Ascosphaera atra]|nr:hypothetical protein KEM55_002064 [Ascosphaera atra]